MQIDLLRRALYWARNFSLTTKNIEIDSSSLWSKQGYYDKYFETNRNKIGKEIRSLISLKTVASSMQSLKNQLRSNICL